MKAGRMRHCLQLQRPVEGADGFQGVTKTWQDVEQVDAAIDSISGRELIGADRELAGLTWRLTLREIPGLVIEPNWRAIEVDSEAPAGRVFDFVAILPSHARNEITIAATSGQSTQ